MHRLTCGYGLNKQWGLVLRNADMIDVKIVCHDLITNCVCIPCVVFLTQRCKGPQRFAEKKGR